ncbi:MAG: translation initiation factor IF-3 [Aggregatilineales bacterium]
MNRQIRVREVRLITDDGENIGVVATSTALEMAAERELDLVEVAPGANPPVCRIMDFGKFQYDKQKRERKARKQQKQVEIKEIQLGPKTDDHHLGFKVKNARRWIEDGMKVRVRIKFKGRENLHPEIGRDRLDKIALELSDVAVIEQMPNREGNVMVMILAPPSDKK